MENRDQGKSECEPTFRSGLGIEALSMRLGVADSALDVFAVCQTGEFQRTCCNSELANGTRARGHPHLRFKDVIKRDMKDMDIDTNTWETLEKKQQQDTLETGRAYNGEEKQRLASELRRVSGYEDRSMSEVISQCFQCQSVSDSTVRCGWVECVAYPKRWYAKSKKRASYPNVQRRGGVTAAVEGYGLEPRL
ncbi:hypothetical protein Bbelb_124110 [Branchiostoma belcheri]|nr:hypothetical protein Bbelb_124110 [Branchiostoma belcheri]